MSSWYVQICMKFVFAYSRRQMYMPCYEFSAWNKLVLCLNLSSLLESEFPAWVSGISVLILTLYFAFEADVRTYLQISSPNQDAAHVDQRLCCCLTSVRANVNFCFVCHGSLQQNEEPKEQTHTQTNLCRVHVGVWVRAANIPSQAEMCFSMKCYVLAGLYCAIVAWATLKSEPWSCKAMKAWRCGRGDFRHVEYSESFEIVFINKKH
jgi:hypothetical protein